MINGKHKKATGSASMPRSRKFPQLVTMRSFVMMKVVHIIKNRSKVIVITHIHENLLY